MKYTPIDTNQAGGATTRPAGSKYTPITPAASSAESYTKRYVPIAEGPAQIPQIAPSAPVVEAPKKPGIISKTSTAVANAIDRPENKGVGSFEHSPEEYAGMTSEQKRKAFEEEAKQGQEILKKSTFSKQLPSAIVESLPFGLGAAFKQIHDMEQYDPETLQYVDNSAKGLAKELPGAVVETGKGFVKAPVSGALNIYDAATNKKTKFNIPGLGEVSSAQARTAERVAAGEDPVQVALEEGSTAILDTLFFVSLASRPFIGRPITTAKSEVPASTFEKIPGASKGLQPKSFRLYEPKTSARPLTPEFIQQAQSQGINLGPKFDPNLPTYFKMTFKPKTSSFVGEVVQIRPSYLKMLSNLWGKKADPGYQYTAKSLGASGHDLDRAIESGDMPVAKVYKNKAGELTPEYAQHVVSDLAGKLDAYHPGLGAKFKTTVDLKNPTPTNLDTQALALLNNTMAGKAPGAVIPIPKLPTPAQIEATPPAQIEILNTKEVKGGDIEEAVKNPIIETKAPETAISPLETGNKSVEERTALLQNKEVPAPKQETTPAPIPSSPENAPVVKAPETTPTSEVKLPEVKETKVETNPEVVRKLETELKDAYKKIPEAEDTLTQILTELDLAEAGKRLFVDDPNGPGVDVIGVSSTFPAWIPENVRTKKSIEALRLIIRDISSISYPANPRATARRAMVDEMLNVLDDRLGIDTRGIRGDIIKQYGGETQKSNSESAGRSEQRAGRGDATPERAKLTEKRIKDLEDEVERLGREIETRDAFEGKLSDEQVSERVARKTEKEAEIAKLKPKKEPLVKSNIQENISPEKPESEPIKKEQTTPEVKVDKAVEKAPTVKNPLMGGFSSGNVEADVDSFRSDVPIELGSMDKVRPIEMPELVDLARSLIGKVPDIKKRMGKKLGAFYHRNMPGDFWIGLRADIFEKPDQAAKILSHELGHLIDYLPDETMARGNLLGRLKTLRNFMGETFGTEKTLMGETEGKLSDSRKAQIKNKITKEVLTARGLKFGDMFGDKMTKAEKASLNKEISEKTREAVNELLDAEGFIQNKVVKKELMDVSLFWRPAGIREILTSSKTGLPEEVFTEMPLEKLPESYQRYRKSSKELYADAISLLFNSPGTLEKMAPTFYKEFFEALDRKPEVFNAYFELQELLGGDRDVLLERRRGGVRGMFDQGDLKAADIQRQRLAQKEARRKDFLFNFKFNLVDKNQALIDRVNKLKKEGKYVSDDENPIYYLEERNYLGGKIKSFMEKNIQPIYEDLIGKNVSWTDFGEALFYDRIAAGDRSDVANPRGITPEAAKELREKMTKQMSEEQNEALDRAVESFREAIKSVAKEAFEEGLYKEEMHAQMLENPAYATFQVLDHLEEGMTSKIHKSIGTLKDVANPADASLLKTISTLRAIERNKVTRSVVEFLEKDFVEDIKPAKTISTPKGPIPQESKLPGEELITYMKDGKRVGFYVDPYIKHSVENNTIGHTVGFLRTLNSAFFRPLFITYNPGFQAFNFIRDLNRFWKNTPGMTVLKALNLYRQSIPAAKARGWGITTNEIIQKMEEEQILSISYNQLTDGAEVEDRQIDTILQASGIDSFQPEVRFKALQPFVKVLDFIKNVGDFIETLPKVAGYLEFTEGGTKPISREDKSFIRKNIGSPDFLAGGFWKPVTNEVFLFSNAITQGIRSDVGVATDPKTRSGYWWKTAKMNIFPKILMILASLGFFGKAVQEIMEGASEYDKTNYTIIPLGRDELGKSVYLRIPQDEGGRLIGGLAWKILNSGNNEQGFGRDMVDIATFTGGQIPSVTPSITTVMATGQYLVGHNPYDWFRNREVLTDDQLKAGPAYSLKPFLGWLFNQSGGGVFYYFSQSPPKDQSGTEKFFNLPVLGNIVGRFLKVSDYGKTEELNQIKAEVQSEQAQKRLDENAVVNDFITEAQKEEGKSVAEIVAENKAALITEILGHPPQDEKELARAKNIEKKFRIGLQRGESNLYINALISAPTTDEKIQLMTQYKESLSDAEFKDIFMTAIENQILSEQFIKDLITNPATKK